jgi:F0F1-type ATP synthase membrane subunit a
VLFGDVAAWWAASSMVGATAGPAGAVPCALGAGLVCVRGFAGVGALVVGMGVLVGVVQSLVFAALVTVYYSLVLKKEGH